MLFSTRNHVYRRFLSFVLICVLCISCAGGIGAYAAEEGLLFDMDLSGFDETVAGTWGIKDGQNNENTLIKVNQGSWQGTSSVLQTGKITEEIFTNVDAVKIPYVKMATWQRSTARKGDAINNQILIENPQWANRSMTTEIWMKKSSTSWTALFRAYAEGDEDSDRTSLTRQATFANQGSNNIWQVGADSGTTSNIYAAIPDDTWLHATISKSVDTQTNEAVYTFYINGSGGTQKTAAALNEATAGLIIGNVQGGHNNFSPNISIASVKMYDGALTNEQIKAHYNAEKTSYEPLGEKLLFDMDLSNFNKDTEGTLGIADKSGNTNVSITANEGWYKSIKTGGLTLEKFLNTDALEVPYAYMVVNNRTISTNYNSETTNNKIFIESEAWANKDMTVEIWMKHTYGWWSNLFRLYGDDDDDRSTLTRYASLNAQSSTVRSLASDSSGTASTYNTSAGDDNWVHVAITKTVNDDGTATYSFSENGSSTVHTRTSNALTEKTAGILIGNPSQNNYYSPSKFGVASVKVYAGALTRNQIAEHYETEKVNFEILTEPVVDINFANLKGDEVTFLDGLESVEVSYSAKGIDEEAVVWAATLDEYDKPVNVVTGCGTDAASLTIPIESGTEKIKVFVWDKDTLKPLSKPWEITYSDDYDPSNVESSIGFYNSSGTEVNYMEGQEGMYALAELFSIQPPDNVYGSLRLVRDGEDIFTETSPASFNGRNATIEISLGNVTPQSGDELVFEVIGDKVYARKKIGFEDPLKTVDVIMVAGQSNALGQGGSASQSLRPKDGTAYYNSMSTKLGGNQGWDSTLAKTWHEQTGHTVLIVKATWGGTGFPTLPNLETGALSQWGSDTYGWWNPGNAGKTDSAPRDCYTSAKNLYNSAVATIDTDKYTIGRCVYFWNQGENENTSYTADMYEEAFMELHNAFITEFGTEETRLTHGGILPVRSASSEFPDNLKLSGPRVAQYNMAKKYDDLFIVSDATEHWYSDASIANWFKSEYNGITYPLSDMPDACDDIMNTDKVHYKQAAMNEMGKQAAISMLAYLEGENTCDGIDLITEDGIQHYKDGDSIYLTESGAIPVIPVSVGQKATFTVKGSAASMDANGVITPNAALLNDYATLEVNDKNGNSMSFKLYSPVFDDSISIAAVKDNKPAVFTLTTDDNYSETTGIIDAELEKHGMVATMGLVADWMGKDGMLTVEEAQSYLDTGRWCVANHTKSHKQSTFKTLTEAELEEEINGGKETLLSYFPDQKILGLYTPGGITSATIRSVAMQNHLLLRLAGGTNNTLPASKSSLYSVNVRGAMASTSLETMNGWVDDAIKDGKWVVEMWHGVGDTDGASWGGNLNKDTAIAHLEYVAEKMNSGDIWVTTLDEVALYMTQRLKSRLSLISKDEDSLVFILTDELNDDIYDEEITVNINIPDGFTSASVTGDGKSVQCVIKDGIASITILPDSGNIEVTFEN